MSRRAKLICCSAVAVAIALSATVALVFTALRHVPAFYEQALAADPQDLARASDELLERASALASDARRTGRWQALFTARQINGWLAVDMPKNHPHFMPQKMLEPRVTFEQGAILLACRYGNAKMSAVCSLKLGVSLLETDTLSVRFEQARAGRLPVPMGEILNAVSRRASQSQLEMAWLQAESDPLAIIKLPQPRDGDTVLSIDTIEVRPEGLYLAGVSGRADAYLAERTGPTRRRALELGRYLKRGELSSDASAEKSQ